MQENGLLHVPKEQAQNAQAQMFSDPNMAMDMMKKNLSMIIPQVLQNILLKVHKPIFSNEVILFSFRHLLLHG